MWKVCYCQNINILNCQNEEMSKCEIKICQSLKKCLLSFALLCVWLHALCDDDNDKINKRNLREIIAQLIFAVTNFVIKLFFTIKLLQNYKTIWTLIIPWNKICFFIWFIVFSVNCNTYNMTFVRLFLLEETKYSKTYNNLSKSYESFHFIATSCAHVFFMKHLDSIYYQRFFMILE